MPEDKKQYLKFTETNPWEGETWTVYTPLDDPSDLSLAKELTSYDYPGQYEFEIVNAHPDQLRQLEAFSDSYDDADLDEGSGYYPSIQFIPMTSPIKSKLQELADFMGNMRQDRDKPDDDHKSLQGIDDRLYKLGIFMP